MERSLTLIALFAALIAALGFVPQIALASGVPISAQSMGVMLAGTVLGAKRGALACLLLIAVVALGMPLLSGGRGGLGVFSGPTVGFFIGWPLAAFTAGLIVERWQVSLKLAAFTGALVGGIFVLYLCGITGMAIVLGQNWWAAALLSAPFVPGDLIKVIITTALTTSLGRLRPALLLSRAKSSISH